MTLLPRMSPGIAQPGVVATAEAAVCVVDTAHPL